MASLTLYTGETVEVDQEDLPLLSTYKWCARRSHGNIYANTKVSGTNLDMHNLLIGFERKDGQVIDHINRNGLDNRKSNLRYCTIAENGMNRRNNKNSTSGIRGVNWCKLRKAWLVRVAAYGKRIHLGYFNCKEEAETTAIAAQKLYWGEFAP